MSNEEIDHERTCDVVCPHCGYAWYDGWELGLSDGDGVRIDCGRCKKPMKVECRVLVIYSTEKIEAYYDLIHVKQWRAWKKWEGPKRLMIRAKNSPNGSCEVLVREGFSYSNEQLFVDFVWMHEDGTATPCGVLE